MFPLNVLAVLAMAALSYTLVERPLLSLRRILAARPAPNSRGHTRWFARSDRTLVRNTPCRAALT